MQPHCPLLRASSEHIPIVRALRARRTVGCLLPFFHGPLHFAAGFARLNGLPAIVHLFPFGQPEFDLRKASFGEIDTEGDERQSLLLRLAEKLIDLLAVEEQLPGAEGFVIHDVAVAVGTDVAMVEKDLPFSHAGVTVLQIHTPISQGLDLRTLEHDTRLELLFYEIVVVGLAISDDGFFETVFLFPHQVSAFHSQHPAILRFTFHLSPFTSYLSHLLAADCHNRFCYDAAMRGPGPIDSLSSILEGVARRLGLESKLLENRMRRDWVTIVGEPIASNTWPDQIRYKKLYLLVHNSVWLHQLTFLKPTLIEKLNRVAGGETVTDIVLRVGEIPARAAASAIMPPIDGDLTMSEAEVAEVSSHVSAIQDPDLRLLFTSVISRNLRILTPRGQGQ